MNRDLLMVATGVGIGALMFTEQGKKLMQATMSGALMPQLGEGKKEGGKESESDKEKDKDDFPGHHHRHKEED
jgi:hypothetical protein